MDSNTLISIHDLEVKYDQLTALEHIQFDIHKGDFIAVVGVNGSGKTTLAKSILGLKKCSKGKIIRQENLQVGYLPQHTGLDDQFFPATVEEIVSTGLLEKKTFPKWINRKDRMLIKEMLSNFGLEKKLKKRIGELSGGQQQRALLARSMIMEPNILILDEPTSALDQNARKKFMDLLKELNHNTALTIILITHDIAGVEDYASRIIYLEKHLLFDGTFDKFCETQPFSPFIHTHERRYPKGGNRS